MSLAHLDLAKCRAPRSPAALSQKNRSPYQRFGGSHALELAKRLTVAEQKERQPALRDHTDVEVNAVLGTRAKHVEFILCPPDEGQNAEPQSERTARKASRPQMI